MKITISIMNVVDNARKYRGEVYFLSPAIVIIGYSYSSRLYALVNRYLFTLHLTLSKFRRLGSDNSHEACALAKDRKKAQMRIIATVIIIDTICK